MLRWHEEKGTKGDVIYHSIMLLIYTIAFIAIAIYVLIALGKGEFNIGIVVAFISLLFLWVVHKTSLNRNVSKYAKYNTYTKNTYSIFDKYVILLMSHYIKKWKPEPFMCCSFKHFDPEVAYKSFDFQEIKSYGKKGISYDECYLYRCNKCGEYVLSLEYHQDKHYTYVPVACAKDAEIYSKEWSYYSMRTTHPILHVIDDKYSWENKA